MTKARDKLAVVDGQPTESALGHLHVLAGDEAINLGQEFFSGHVAQDDGQSPISQWAISQVTLPAGVGSFPRMTLGWRKRLRDILTERNLNMKTLSQDAGLGETFVRDVLERERDPSLEKILKVTRALGISISEIVGDATGAGPDTFPVPVYDIRASAGGGSLNDDDAPKHHLFFREAWLRRLARDPKRLLVLEISGDSMWDTLHDGDHALVDLSQADPRRDGLFVIRIDDMLQVKRISMHPVARTLTVKSDNPVYPTYSDIPPDDIAVVGRVVWIGRSLG